MTRLAPRLLVLLATSALVGCSMLSPEPALREKLGVNDKAPPAKNIANDLDGNIRQAQLLRLAGKYDEAIQILSQLTLIAADDPRVVGEYGKALAQKGRAQDANQFLRRAAELSPNDWTIYSAMGVAYDQGGDHVNAAAAYDRALSLRPGEASVLNNFALSRMLAKDPEGARTLIAQAQAASAPGDEKVARNLALINEMAPAPVVAQASQPAAQPTQVASNAPKAIVRPPAAAKPAPQVARPNPPIPVVETPVAANDGPRNAGDVARRLAGQSPVQAPVAAAGAPRSLMPVDQFLTVPPEANQAVLVMPQQAERRVVMQAVPFDPLAGPVKPRPVAKPRAVASAKKAPEQKAEVPSLRVANEKY